MLFKISTICLLITGCLASGQRPENKTIRCVAVYKNYPVFNAQGKVERFTHYEERIFYSGEMVMVEMGYQFDSLVNNQLVKSEIRHRYLVYKKGNSAGTLYDEGTGEELKSVSVDSVLRLQWFNNLNIYDMFIQNDVTLISAVRNSSTGTLKEQYAVVSKKDTAQKGRFDLYYSNRLKDIDYSLSRELDSIKGMKLDSILMVNDAHLFREGNIWIEKVDQWFKLSEDTSFDKLKIQKYFSKYGGS
jgi:hypothetical protein